MLVAMGDEEAFEPAGLELLAERLDPLRRHGGCGGLIEALEHEEAL